MTDPRRRPIPFATLLLIALNVGVFLWMSAVDSRAGQSLGQINYLTQWGGNVQGLTLAGEPWRLATNTMIHAGFAHLAFNMLVLWELGVSLERRMGRLALLTLYALAGVGASLASASWQEGVVSVGASGAIFGLLGAAIVLSLWSRSLEPSISPWRALAAAAITLAMGLFLPLDNIAHVGGLALGVLLALPWLVAERTGRAAHAPFALCAAATAIGLGALTLHLQDSDAAQRVGLAQLHETLYSAHADGRHQLRQCALVATQMLPQAGARDVLARCMPQRTEHEDEGLTAGWEFSPPGYAQRAVEQTWPQCMRQARRLQARVSDPRRLSIARQFEAYCRARSQMDRWLFLDGPAPLRRERLNEDVATLEIMLHATPSRRSSSFPLKPLLRLNPKALPPSMQDTLRTLSAWNDSITADDWETAKLDRCPYVDCRRRWASELPRGLFMLP